MGGRWQGARGIRSKVAHFRLPFFPALLCYPCFPLAFQLAAEITFFCYCIVRGVAGKWAEGRGEVRGIRFSCFATCCCFAIAMAVAVFCVN